MDISDLGTIGTHWSLAGQGTAQGDFNGDGRVNVSDLGIVGANWQKTLPSASPTAGSFPAAASLPETITPASLDAQGSGSVTVLVSQGSTPSAEGLLAGNATASASGKNAPSVVASYAKGTGESVRELVTLPSATSKALTYNRVAAAFESLASQQHRSVAANSAVLYAAAQLDTNFAGSNGSVPQSAATPLMVDSSTVSQDSPQLLANQRSRAIDPQAVDRIDLLTVVEYELGHILGLRDLNTSTDDLMSG